MITDLGEGLGVQSIAIGCLPAWSV